MDTPAAKTTATPTDSNRELKDLVLEIRADHQAQKEKEKRDSWTKYVSLSMICLAVLTAYVTQKGGGYSSAVMKQLNEATFNQAAASDQWSFFQAKGIKEDIFMGERELLKANANSTTNTASIAALTKKINAYETEKNNIKADAEKFETARDTAKKVATAAAEMGRKLSLSSTLFQIAIALGGMCLVVKKRWLWWISMSLGAIALIHMITVLV